MSNLQIIDVEQGSEEWRKARLGVVTASCFSQLMAKGEGKTRRTYMMKLIGERLTGELSEQFSNVHTERGTVMEPQARALYELEKDVQIMPCGFMKRGDVGYSPDGLIGEDGLIEIKSKLPHLHLELMLKDEAPSEHMAQMQGGLWISEREFCDFVSYWPGLPLFVKRVYRDEKYIKQVSDAVDAFLTEMQQTIDQIIKKAA